MSKTGFVFHRDYLKHGTGKEHPENPQRLKAIVATLEKGKILSKLKKIEAEHSTLEWVEEIHTKPYIEQIQKVGKKGAVLIDQDTMVGPDTYQVALLAVSGVLAACDAVMAKKVRNVFCAVRPPGHHAEKDRAMGFCVFNTAAVAAKYLQKKYNLKRIMIIDWDAHHGNGTQNTFYDDGSVYYFSIHQYPHYPGTGGEEEKGAGSGEGSTLNVPMCAGSGDLEYKEVFEMIFYPDAVRFNPQFIIISAGFDGHKDDPLSEIQISEKGYQKMTEVVMNLAEKCCQGRIVSILEGGYNLVSLSSSVKAHIQTLSDYKPKGAK